MIQKTSIRFFNKTAVRAVWDADDSRWLYSATDVVSALVGSSNPRVYWNTLKARNPQLSTFCRQLKLTAADGKRYATDCIPQKGVECMLLVLPGNARAFPTGSRAWRRRSMSRARCELTSCGMPRCSTRT